MPQLDRLPARDDDGNVLCVIEAPRGSRVKLKFEPRLGAMIVGRPLPLGVHYPFDFGFVPGTCAQDGDPIDVMVLHDAPTFPGVVIPATLIGVVKVEETKRGKKQRNDRLLAIAASAPRFDGLRDARKLPRRARDELATFFLTAVAFTPKAVRVLGFGGAREADRLLNDALLP